MLLGAFLALVLAGQAPPAQAPPGQAPGAQAPPAQAPPAEAPPGPVPPAPGGAPAPAPGAARAPGAAPALRPGAAPAAGGQAGQWQPPPLPPLRAGEPPFNRKYELRLTLEEAIQLAIRRNLEIVIQEINREIVERDLVISRAVFDPFFNLSATYSKGRSPSANILEFDPLTGVRVLGVRVNPSDTSTIRGGIHGLTPLGSTYELSLVESRFNTPEAGIFALNPRYSTRAEATITQPLLKNAWLGFNMANVRTAQNNIQLVREQLTLAAITTVFNVETAYWNLVFGLNNFQAKVRAMEVTQEQLRIDRKKLEVGTKAAIDVTTSESQVARRQTEYDQAAALLEDAWEDLLEAINYVGRDESLRGRWQSPQNGDRFRRYGEILVIPTTESKPGPVEVDRSQALKEAFENRVEYHQADLRLRNQELAVEVARNQLLPALDLTASWFQLGLEETLGGSLDQVRDGDFYDWSVGALFEIPLSLRGPRAQYRNATDLHRRLLYEKQNLENQIVLEVDNAIRDLEYAYRAVVNLEKQVQLQVVLLRGERVKLEVGTSIAYTVAQIENDLIAILAQGLRAKADYEIARAALERAQGRLLQRRGVDLGF